MSPATNAPTATKTDSAESNCADKGYIHLDDYPATANEAGLLPPNLLLQTPTSAHLGDTPG